MDTSAPRLPNWATPFQPDTTKPLTATPELLQQILGLRPWAVEQDFVGLARLVTDGVQVTVQPSRAGQFGSVEFVFSNETVAFLRSSFALDDTTLCLTVGRFAALMASMYGHQVAALARMCERAFLTTARRADQAVRDSRRFGVYCEPDTGRVFFEGKWYAGVPAIAEELGCTRWVLNERMRTHNHTLAEAVADIRLRGVAPPRLPQRAEVDGKVYASVREAMRSLGHQGTWDLPRLVKRGEVKLLGRETAA